MLTWMLIGVILLVLEILSATFFIIFFGLAALTVSAILFFILFPLHYQILGFATLAFLYLVIFRKLLKKQKKNFDAPDELLGKIALVQENIIPHHIGKVILGDTNWNATSSVEIQKGTKVKILSHNNLTLEVTPL